MIRPLIVLAATLLMTWSVPGTTPVPRAETNLDPACADAIRKLETDFVGIRIETDLSKEAGLKDGVVALACDLLNSDDPCVRNAVLPVLRRNSRVVDMARLEGCSPSLYDEEPSSVFLKSVMDTSQLFFSEESEKREILKECMEKGSVHLWRGTGLNAKYCMGISVWDGIPGLWAEVEKTYATKLSESDREMTSLDELSAAYNILEGEGTGWDQRNNAVGLILEMEKVALGKELEHDSAFRSTVLNLLSIQCTQGRKLTCEELRTGIDEALREFSAQCSQGKSTPCEGLRTGIDEELQAMDGAGTKASALVSDWWSRARFEEGVFSPDLEEKTPEEEVREAIIRSIVFKEDRN